ncbi:MAG: RNA polymerase sigma factor RpoH [Flavobacteriaceae bacterium TMED238]|nr:RNA polymerase sigma factor RpoH [Flammeovirgaceae bacterium]RPG61048.1 MAG: RNA polymerase sigma factor RpoH [Flavobacteriaceae bacterium TMED238]|tara:strand:+ start:476 stop:1336 length:861 start_codon:yes stop_codon:yes gene_type:complete
MNNYLSLSSFGNADSFSLYQQSIQEIPFLTEEEEYELGMRLKKDNDLEAAKKLILSHLKLVMKIARSYSGYGLPQSDLVQEGNIGLMKAVKKFDVERGVRLVSYAMFWIKAEIQEYVVKNWRLVKIATTKAQRKLFFNLRSLKTKLQPLAVEEIKSIAKSLKLKEEDVREMELRFNGQELSMDYSNDDSEEEQFRPIAYLKDSAPLPAEVLEKSETESNNTKNLQNALKKLDSRSREIVEARWLKENKPDTLHDLAKKYKVSAERVRQIEQNAMKKIKILITSATS